MIGPEIEGKLKDHRHDGSHSWKEIIQNKDVQSNCSAHAMCQVSCKSVMQVCLLMSRTALVGYLNFIAVL